MLSRSSSRDSLSTAASTSSSRSTSNLCNSLLHGSTRSPATSSEGSSAAVNQDAAAGKRPQQASSSQDGTTPVKKTRLKSEEHVALAQYPTQHLLHLLAALLQRMATANDAVRASNGSDPAEPLYGGPIDASRPVTTPYPRLPYLSPMQSLVAATTSSAAAADQDYFSLPPDAPGHAPGAAPLSPRLTASRLAYKNRNATLGFHARNVPGIGIEQYLLRILKYCPTTNEVFIALLVYFDRMARYMPLQPPPAAAADPSSSAPASPHAQRPFCVDSFNVHRLVIAGVTVASKFFSDVFYTNSRYAKVGGLPLAELNQLELQFLLLNDFALVVDVAELQQYADRLLLPSHQRAAEEPGRPPAAAADASTPLRPRERQGSESTSGSSTVGGRSETSSVASSTGTVTGADGMDVDAPEPPAEP